MKDNDTAYKSKGIDVLRGIGIIGIVLYHIFPDIFPGGFLGVIMFFVLSGYLMFTTCMERIENNSFSIINYYKKRALKIYPPLFIMVVCVCCYLTLTDINKLSGIRTEILSIFGGYNNWWQIWQDASYFSRFTDASCFTHLWFLSLEIQFYILWPFILILYYKLYQMSNSKITCFLFPVLAIISALIMLRLYIPGEEPTRVYYGTDTMSFSLFTGMFLGALRKYYNKIRCPADKITFFTVLSFSAAVIFILFITVYGRLSLLYRGGMFIISIFFAFILNIMENNRNLLYSIPVINILSAIGKKSYIIYLWHYPVIIIVLNYLKGRCL